MNKFMKKKFIPGGLILIMTVFFAFHSTALALSPTEPEQLRVVSGDEKVYLSWSLPDDTTDIMGIRIYVSKDRGDTFAALTALPGTPPPVMYEAKSLINGEEYLFAITTYNNALEESDKVTSNIVIPANTALTDIKAPEDVTNLKGKTGDSKITLSWNKSADTANDLVGYRVYTAESAEELKFDKAVNVGNVINYAVTGLENGKEYVFKVVSLDEVPNYSKGAISSVLSPGIVNEEVIVPGVELGENLPSTNTFNDVNSDNVFKGYIEFLASRNVMKGYANGAFKPNQNLTRAEAVKIILQAAGLTDIKEVTKTSFNDLSPDNPLAKYVEEAYLYNIVRGYGDNKFYPDRQILRKEFAKMFMEATEGTLTNPVSKAYFIDVDLTNTFAKWIYSAYKKGYINGYSDNTFKPDAPITRAEASKILAKYLQGEVTNVPESSNLELYLLSLINSKRLDIGVDTFTIDGEMSTVARNHADDLVRNVKTASYIGSDGRTLFTRLKDAGISYNEASENVAKIKIGQKTKFDALKNLIDAVMSLPDSEQNQKANILTTFKKFNIVGIGITEDTTSSELYVVIDFIAS